MVKKLSNEEDWKQGLAAGGMPAPNIDIGKYRKGVQYQVEHYGSLSLLHSYKGHLVILFGLAINIPILISLVKNPYSIYALGFLVVCNIDLYFVSRGYKLAMYPLMLMCVGTPILIFLVFPALMIKPFFLLAVFGLTFLIYRAVDVEEERKKIQYKTSV